VAKLDKNDAAYEHHLLEALWLGWGLNRPDPDLVRQLLQSKDYHARAAAVRVVRYAGHQLKDGTNLLLKAAADPHGRVRLEAITAASWLDKATGMLILNEAAKKPLDDWMKEAHLTAVSHINGRKVPVVKEAVVVTPLQGKELQLFTKGKAIYARDGFCITCHQKDGKGLTCIGLSAINRHQVGDGQ
jgi:hypothetical protein